MVPIRGMPRSSVVLAQLFVVNRWMKWCGIAVETVTEDAHTSLRLHRLGYSSAYLRYPLAAGLATETLSAHIGQRIRWARHDPNFTYRQPVVGKRPATISASVLSQQHDAFFVRRTATNFFYVHHCAPFFFFSVGLIDATVTDIMSYVLPYLFIVVLINSRIQGKYRHSFWNEIYEMVLAGILRYRHWWH